MILAGLLRSPGKPGGREPILLIPTRLLAGVLPQTQEAGEFSVAW